MGTRKSDEELVAEIDRLIKPWGCRVTGIGPDSVGVMGDARAYLPSVLVRFPADADWEEIQRISTAITNEVRGVSRVLMDVETTPPTQ